MKIKIIYIFLLTLLPIINFGLSKEEYEQFKQAVNASHKRSYFAPVNFGEINNLIFESRISDHYFINFRRNTNWAADAEINLTIRMLDQKSVPINTPNYNPGINLYYYSKDKRLFGGNIVYSLGLYHYSNGQNGDFYNSDGSINYKNGNFSTNYISIKSFSLFRDPKRNYIKKILGGQFMYYIDPYPTMKPLFPKARLDIYLENFITNLYKEIDLFNWENKSYYQDKDIYTLHRFKLNIGFLLGYMQNTKFLEDKIIFEITHSYKPTWLDDFSFFIKYYYGRDYYNIHFTEKISQFSIGIMSDNFVFRSDK